jgi:hypothetical protein
MGQRANAFAALPLRCISRDDHDKGRSTRADSDVPLVALLDPRGRIRLHRLDASRTKDAEHVFYHSQATKKFELGGVGRRDGWRVLWVPDAPHFDRDGCEFMAWIRAAANEDECAHREHALRVFESYLAGFAAGHKGPSLSPGDELRSARTLGRHGLYDMDLLPPCVRERRRVHGDQVALGPDRQHGVWHPPAGPEAA